ncbi:exo-beta-N-acetylmuramidase NamZ domain-containing protein [Saltatorellus ferox]
MKSLILACLAALPPASGLPQEAIATRTAEAVTTARGLENAAEVVRAAVADGLIPGAVLLVGRGDEILLEETFGERAPGVPMTADTVFDMASVTKSVATGGSILKLIEEGKLRLTDRVDAILPDLVPADFGGAATPVTVEHLLLHTSGLAPASAVSDFEGHDNAVDGAIRTFTARPLRSVPGAAFAYSDLGFITLGKIVERVSGQPLDVFTREKVLLPLGMTSSSFGPLDEERLARTASTEPGTPLGVVHDPRSRAASGVTGHAGLFSTARDLGRFCALLSGATATDSSALEASTVALMTKARFVPSPKRDVEKVAASSNHADHGTARALALDVQTGYSSPRGSLFPRFRSFGHTGFTGPCFWIDARTDVWYVLMASRLQGGKNPSLSPLRRATADAVASATDVHAPRLAPAVQTGIDVLETEDCARLAGKRLGLITNVTGKTASGKRTIDVLHESKNANLVRIFSPEHGLFGKLEGKVGNATDEATELPVFSLYGETRKPTPEMLEGLDALLFDIQDVGVRYYTYPSTLGLAMEACAAAGVEVIVLDRPNPITGRRVSGPLTDADRLSFIGWRPMPLTHGMTIGELGKMFNAEWGGIGAELTVVPMEGWSRGMWYEETGVPWINPSPNMRNPTQAVLYPCIGLLEGANLSVGRGTDEPFELFGAPWIDGKKLADALRAEALPGVEFTPIVFTPDAAKFIGEECGGVHITVVDRDAFAPVAAGMAILWHLNDLFGQDFNAARGDSRLLSARTFEDLMGAGHWREIPPAWMDDVDGFLHLRAPYLLYK